MKGKIFFLLFWSACLVSAQERATFEVGPRADVANSFSTIEPINMAESRSVATLSCKHTTYELYEGDVITKITFRGYNPGEPANRTVKVGLGPKDGVMTVFEGNVTIPHGGSEEQCIALLEVEVKNYMVTSSRLELTVESSGEPRPGPIYFESFKSEDTGIMYSVPVFTVSSEVISLTGTVTNQDGRPIRGATLSFNTSYGERTGNIVRTDVQGHYEVQVRKKSILTASLSASGCADYQQYGFWNSQRPMDSHDIVMTDAVHYRKGQRATIILPVAPSPSLGRYYLPVERVFESDGKIKVLFRREQHPEANVPYVIFPTEDFDIFVSDYELQGLSDTYFVPCPYEHESAGGTKYGLYGTYKSQRSAWLPEGCWLHILDQRSSDFNFGDAVGTNCQTGAFRGYWVDYYNAEAVFEEETTGIHDQQYSDKATNVYDLTGRKLTHQPQRRGIYVRNSEKYVVR